MNKDRKLIIAGNWKMNKTVAEALALVDDLKRELGGVKEVDLVVCPSFTAISEVGLVLSGSRFDLGGQDLHWEEGGAFTGEVSAAQLRSAGCRFVERILTVVQTCRLHEKNSLEYLCEAVRNLREGLPCPGLLPQS